MRKHHETPSFEAHPSSPGKKCTFRSASFRSKMRHFLVWSLWPEIWKVKTPGEFFVLTHGFWRFFVLKHYSQDLGTSCGLVCVWHVRKTHTHSYVLKQRMQRGNFIYSFILYSKDPFNGSFGIAMTPPSFLPGALGAFGPWWWSSRGTWSLI